MFDSLHTHPCTCMPDASVLPYADNVLIGASGLSEWRHGGAAAYMMRGL